MMESQKIPWFQTTNLYRIPSGKLTQLWKITIFYEKNNYKWPFSIATLNYQRILDDVSMFFPYGMELSCRFPPKKPSNDDQKIVLVCALPTLWRPTTFMGQTYIKDHKGRLEVTLGHMYSLSMQGWRPSYSLLIPAPWCWNIGIFTNTTGSFSWINAGNWIQHVWQKKVSSIHKHHVIFSNNISEKSSSPQT